MEPRVVADFSLRVARMSRESFPRAPLPHGAPLPDDEIGLFSHMANGVPKSSTSMIAECCAPRQSKPHRQFESLAGVTKISGTSLRDRHNESGQVVPGRRIGVLATLERGLLRTAHRLVLEANPYGGSGRHLPGILAPRRSPQGPEADCPSGPS